MSALHFSVADAYPAPHTAAPAVVFRLRITSGSRRVHAVALRAQVQIEAPRRRYTADEQRRLYELFGEPAMWDRTLRGVLWTQTSIVVPAFDGETMVDLPVPCTYDLDVAAGKYLHAVRDGEVPLIFLFTGTVFTLADGAMQAEPISWDTEAPFPMPAGIWREAMDRFFPGGGWIRLSAETLDRLQAYKGLRAALTWDAAMEGLLERAEAKDPA